MFAVNPKVASSGTVQNAVSSAPTPAIAAATGSVRTGRWNSQTASAPTTTKMPTTTWQRIVTARSSAGSHGRRRDTLEEQEHRGTDGEELGTGTAHAQAASEEVRARGEHDRTERGDELERDVVGQDQIGQHDQERREREVELPGREPREPVG